MRRPGRPPRLNRLPQHLDYTLIPAPLDLSLPLVDEKAPLPAIIVTPSSPSHDGDFSIAFLIPPQKPTAFRRLWGKLTTLPSFFSHSQLPSAIQLPSSATKDEFEHSSYFSLKTRARVAIVVLLLLFIMGCHLIMHSLATGRPHMAFDGHPGTDTDTLTATDNMDAFGAAVYAHGAEDASPPAAGGWFDLGALWAPMPSGDAKRNPEFIISEAESEAV
ncbi:hypothetical protein SCP_0205700 [Sparassis crispa]|uniref:Uncharacterized protein n=1 Tax=Sparassis crispa TaxID=139825 RepID=A0A401GB34_9APHY|nr:hypothetical protein SCP_0205700 [Sparassis crispa]GBE79372.1 hypothetical protein SCP_0205700 [Sparassis crispa]